MSLLGALPRELWPLIAECLPSHDILNICRTSHEFNQLCLPVLYKDIDLSHLDIIAISDKLGPRRGPFDTALGDPTCRTIRTRQNLFYQTITRKPKQSKYARSLAWAHVVDVRHYPFWNREAMATFAALDHVRRLDMYASKKSFLLPNREPAMRNLFPRATHIRLAGTMSIEWVKAILLGKEKSDIQSLILGLEPFTNELEGVDIFRGYESKLLAIELQSRCLKLEHFALQRITSKSLTPGDLRVEFQAWAHLISTLQARKITLWIGTPAFEDEENLTMDEIQREEFQREQEEIYIKSYIQPILRTGWPSLEEIYVRGIEVRGLLTERLQSVKVTIDKKTAFKAHWQDIDF